ncbi:hypothetical protein R3P38DRAFT_3225005 [Favolaschia claudopus]|uniref:Uncharacterized protein n=1 Tax=Favolaschia claudopus TaxID=2862362 RepID=A0AAV9ZV92_9AGAR
MNWYNISETREVAFSEFMEGAKSVHAILIPDGPVISQLVWVRVPFLGDVRQARTAAQVNAELWFDASRGSGEAWVDLEGRVFDFNFKSKHEERECQYSFTVVVAPQHATGNDVHPVNYHIMKTVDGLDRAWRGNVLVFKRGKSRNRPFVDIQPADIVALEWVIPKVFLETISPNFERDDVNE